MSLKSLLFNRYSSLYSTSSCRFVNQFNRNFAVKVGSTRFTSSHEWVKLVSKDQVTIGITDHAQSELGDIVFIELPETGIKLKAGDSFGTVESVKATSSVYTPVSGEVQESNSKILNDNSLVNKAAETDGWMVKLKLTKPEELDKLMDTDQYKKHVASAKH